jgi:chromosome segregation protein
VELQRGELARAEERLARARETHSQQRTAVDRQRERTTSAQSAASSAHLEESRLQAAAERALEALAGLQRELQGREERSARDAAALATLGAELEGLEADVGAAGAELESFRGAVVELDQRILGASQRLEEARLQIVGLEAEARAESRRTEELRRRREQLLAREQAATLRIQAAEAMGLEAQEKLAAAKNQAGIARAQMQRAAEQRAQAVETAVDPIRGLAELERRRAELDASVRSAVGAAEGIRGDVGAQMQRVDQLRSELDESLGADPAGDEPQEVHEPAKAAQEIARLERRLNAVGLVNELAPCQLTQLLERTEGLRSAHDDCLRTKSELDQLLRRLQELSGGRFERTLQKVAKEFESVWVELFGGGRAALVATPGENGAPGGVEMEVQPQGKRSIPMPLLSGGERALTALALVLALQQVSPSPFYVFDEVDAALDEANIAQFAKLLQRRAKTSQFVVVTHSLTTMSKASILYGVTQDGDGSSRLLSVRLTADGQSVEAQEGARLESVAARG